MGARMRVYQSVHFSLSRKRFDKLCAVMKLIRSSLSLIRRSCINTVRALNLLLIFFHFTANGFWELVRYLIFRTIVVIVGKNERIFQENIF